VLPQARRRPHVPDRPDRRAAPDRRELRAARQLRSRGLPARSALRAVGRLGDGADPARSARGHADRGQLAGLRDHDAGRRLGGAARRLRRPRVGHRLGARPGPPRLDRRAAGGAPGDARADRTAARRAGLSSTARSAHLGVTVPPTLSANCVDLLPSDALNWVSSDALWIGYSAPSAIVVSLVPVPEIPETV